MLNLYQRLAKFGFEVLASAPVTHLFQGRAWYNSTLNNLQYYNGTTSKTLLETDTAQVVTAKDIDGGTASNTSRITLPKASTATLAALTRKQATIVYDTTTNKGYLDDGATLNELSQATGGTLADQRFARNSTTDVTVLTGTTIFLPFYTIDSGDDYVINSGGALAGIGSLNVDGTLTVNGLMTIAS